MTYCNETQEAVNSERNHTGQGDIHRTGRKHQIRAQLSAIGVPIRGDIKYGSKRTNPDGAIDLHAYKLHFQHPANLEYKKIIAPVSEEGLWKYIDPELVKSI